MIPVVSHHRLDDIHKITKNTLVKITTNTSTLILVPLAADWDSL
jgi:hypothetical protein